MQVNRLELSRKIINVLDLKHPNVFNTVISELQHQQVSNCQFQQNCILDTEGGKARQNITTSLFYTFHIYSNCGQREEKVKIQTIKELKINQSSNQVFGFQLDQTWCRFLPNPRSNHIL